MKYLIVLERNPYKWNSGDATHWYDNEDDMIKWWNYFKAAISFPDTDDQTLYAGGFEDYNYIGMKRYKVEDYDA